MAEADEDLFADLYEDEPTVPSNQAAAPGQPLALELAQHEPVAPDAEPESNAPVVHETQYDAGGSGGDMEMHGGGFNGQTYNNDGDDQDDNYGPINVKEDGKMFIGGLNWETTDQSLKDYFSQFGEVAECTVMRDSTTGRSRGFGFLTFKDPKCVNTVMVKEHHLDGKIIDPKRAIPREEQEKTSKIFVGGVSQEATDDDFRHFFMQFGRVVDSTLMMDKDTGRPRGFGFVTFDSDTAVDATLKGPLQIHGKAIEVKRAQPRGNMREEEDNKKFGARGNKFGSRNDGNGGGNGGGFDAQQNDNGQGGTAPTPAQMAHYWQQMQQFFMRMQAGMSNGGGMPVNPGLMQGMNYGGDMSQGMGPGMGPGMNPAMMQQMQQMQQMQMQQQQQQQQQGNQNFGNQGYGAQGPMGGGAQMPGQARAPYNAQEQLAFEQQKYEQQQARIRQQQTGYSGQGGPTSWEGMYEDIPQPTPIPSGPAAGNRPNSQNNNFGNAGRGNFNNNNLPTGPSANANNRSRQGSSQPPTGPSNAPANAPTGPKNPGKPFANYRGGGRGGGAGYRHNPYGKGY